MFEKLKFWKKETGRNLKGLVFGNNSWLSSPWASKARIDSYATSVYVHAAVKKRAEKFAQLINFTLRDRRTGNEVDDADNWILNLLAKPNPYQTKNEFFELYQTYKDLSGSVFVYLLRVGGGENDNPFSNQAGEVKEMHLLAPDKVTVMVSAESGLPEFYKYSDSKGGETVYSANDIIATFYPNPLEFASDRFKGFSSLMPLAKRVETEKQLIDYQYNILKNGGKVEGILKFKTEVLSETQIDEIKQSYDRQFAEAKKSGRPLVLYGDTEYEKVGQTSEELAYLESLKMTRDDVLMVYGVPKSILGLTDDISRANGAEANAMFIKDTIKPLIENCVSKFDEFLVPDEWELDFVDPTPDDVELILKKIDSGTNNHYLTINERRELMGLEPRADGDQILVPFNLVPMDNVGLPPAEESKGLKKKLK